MFWQVWESFIALLRSDGRRMTPLCAHDPNLWCFIDVSPRSIQSFIFYPWKEQSTMRRVPY